MKKITTVFYVFAVLTLFVLMAGCGSSKKETAEDNTVTDADNDIAADGDVDNTDIDDAEDTDPEDSETNNGSDETEDADAGSTEPGDDDAVTDSDIVPDDDSEPINNDTCTTIDGRMWSPRATDNISCYDGINYCNNLTECGYSDWRMPTIDELRTLIQNCPQTESGGKCRISEENGKLYTKAWYPQGYCYCDWKDGSDYSKLGDSNQTVLWSSSERSDVSDSAWLVLFGDARVNAESKYGSAYGLITVRCVR